MNRYQTFQWLGAQRAHIGKPVIVACARLDGEPGLSLRAGVVATIEEDTPYIAIHGDPAPPSALPFADVYAEHMNDMKIGSWTWPPR